MAREENFSDRDITFRNSINIFVKETLWETRPAPFIIEYSSPLRHAEEEKT